MNTSSSVSINFLSRFEAQLYAALHAPRHMQQEPRILLESAQYLTLGNSAKRMRPMLVDHFGAALGTPEEDRLILAIVAELVHTASLMHDDVIDAGTTRRGRPTVNMQWSNSVAVLGGDLLLCIALEQLEGLAPKIVFDTIELVAEMTRAAMLEVQARIDGGWTLIDWEHIADGKTGALLAWCGRAVALASSRPIESETFADCGRHLGIAFQLTDDLIDLMSTSGETGKDRLADLRLKNPSYPVALARSISLPVRTALDEVWSTDQPSPESLEKIAAQIVELGVPQQTVTQIEHHLDQAIDALGAYANGPGGEFIAAWAWQLRQVARQTLENI